MDSKPRPIGKDLRRWRVARGLRQADVAREAGLHQSRISDLERGRVLPTAAQLVRLGRFYGKDVGVLVLRLASEQEARRHEEPRLEVVHG